MPDVVRVLEEGVCDKRGGDRESVGYNSMLSVEELSVLAPSHLVREGSSTQLVPPAGISGTARFSGRTCVCVWSGLDWTRLAVGRPGAPAQGWVVAWPTRTRGELSECRTGDRM